MGIAEGAAHALNTVKKEVLRRRFPRELKPTTSSTTVRSFAPTTSKEGQRFAGGGQVATKGPSRPSGAVVALVEGAGTFGGSNPYGQQLGGAVAANGRGSSPLGMKPGGRGSPMSPGRSGSPGLDIRVSPVPTTEMVLGGSPPLGAADAASLGAWHRDGSGSGGGRNGGRQRHRRQR